MKVLIIDNWEDTVGEMTSQYTAGVTYEMDDGAAGRAAKAKATHDPAARALVKMKPLKQKKSDIDQATELKKAMAGWDAAKADNEKLTTDLAAAADTFKQMEATIATLTAERDTARDALSKT